MCERHGVNTIPGPAPRPHGPTSADAGSATSTAEGTTSPRRRDRGIGVVLPRDLPAASVLDFARRAEEIGLDELWVVEDLGFRGGIAQAAAVLASTQRIRVGIGILPTAARNVAFAAMELNTLAELFPGRVHAGVGHGVSVWMVQVGAKVPSPLGAFDEHVSALRALLRGEEVNVDGAYVRLSGVVLETPAAIVPPVLAGVRGPRSLALAGRVADGIVLAEPATPEYIRRALEQVGDPDARVAVYNVASIDDDRACALDTARPALEWIGEPDWAPHITPLDFAEDFAALRARSASRAEFAAALPDAWVEQLAVAGTPDEARARIGAMHDAGADTVVLILAGADPFAGLESLAGLVG